ncbi:MAG: hypothetical protein L3J13_01910 [Devosiaceae bacterium]|nr:hypothetical protein [Devosiaceae bacterium]
MNTRQKNSRIILIIVVIIGFIFFTQRDSFGDTGISPSPSCHVSAENRDFPDTCPSDLLPNQVFSGLVIDIFSLE